jgi:hypothetical protein
MAARTRNGPLVGSRRRELEQFSQRCGPSLMQGRTNSHLDGFQIQTTRLAATVENDEQQLIYFSRDFLADRFRSFFSWALSDSSSTGRKPQIPAFTSTNS